MSAARAVLETGAADYAWNLQVDPDALAKMEATGRGKVVSAFSSLVERIVVNQTNPAPALRGNRSEYMNGENPHPFLIFTPIPQAMSMAIDRTIISEQLYGFAGEPICNLVAGPPDYASTANDGCLSQDIEGANLLLEDHDVLDTDGDGIREYNGVPLRITYQTSTNSIRQDTQVFIDVAHCHAVLMHVPDTAAALAEVKRVLKPGGIISSREMIVGSSFLGPSTDNTDAAWATFAGLLAANGGHPSMGKDLKSILLDAGVHRRRGDRVL